MGIRLIAAAVIVSSLFLLAGCGGGTRRVEGSLVYLALGASDAVGIGASPLDSGCVYLLANRLEGARSQPVHLLNLGNSRAG